MTPTLKSRENVSKHQSLITDSLQLNGIYLLSCVIVLGTFDRLVNLDVGRSMQPMTPSKP